MISKSINNQHSVEVLRWSYCLSSCYAIAVQELSWLLSRVWYICVVLDLIDDVVADDVVYWCCLMCVSTNLTYHNSCKHIDDGGVRDLLSKNLPITVLNLSGCWIRTLPLDVLPQRLRWYDIMIWYDMIWYDLKIILIGTSNMSKQTTWW